MRYADFENHHIEGYARAAQEKGDSGYFKCDLVSQIDGNRWTGGCYDSVPLPEDFEYVLSVYQWERYKLPDGCERLEVEMYDSGDIPDVEQLHELADWVNEKRALGKTLVHCQAGLNRSSLVTALALVKSGKEPQEAIDLLREKRSPMVLCNQHFENWLHQQKPPIVVAAGQATESNDA